MHITVEDDGHVETCRDNEKMDIVSTLITLIILSCLPIPPVCRMMICSVVVIECTCRLNLMGLAPPSPPAFASLLLDFLAPLGKITQTTMTSR